MKLELSPEELRQLNHRSIPLGTEAEIIEAFHRLSYGVVRGGAVRTWHACRFRGYQVFKIPQDLWLYMELIWEVKPRTIIETGTADGGSALYFASLLDWLGKDRIVITIDVKPLNVRYPKHDRIFYVPNFSSLDWPPKRGFYKDGLQISIAPKLEPPVMVVLDSDHAEKHVARELEIYGPLVTEGSYLVVEDTNVNGHPVNDEHGPGPREALDAWLPAHPEFKEDRARATQHLFSYHTWLKRVDAPDRSVPDTPEPQPTN